MNSDMIFLIELVISFLPFVLFAILNSKANVKKEIRNRQYPLPAVAVLFSFTLMLFSKRFTKACIAQFLLVADLFVGMGMTPVAEFMYDMHETWGIYLELVLFNTDALLLYVIVKRMLTAVLAVIKVKRNTFIGSVVELFYSHEEQDDSWYIKEHFGQACTFIKTTYLGSCAASGLALLISCGLCMKGLVNTPFYPVFAVIIIGEMAFFVDGTGDEGRKSAVEVQADRSRHVAMYPLLRKPLRTLFGDKLSAEGTTVNTGIATDGAIEDILASLERDGGHIGKNYALFVRRKMENGLKPNVDYVRCGYDLATGKSLLFNTPFYDKLSPYVFYAMNRELLVGGKVLIVLGRHGTEEDLLRWSAAGMKSVSNIPDLWKITVLDGKKVEEDALPDIGIISCSGVHDLDIHKSNLPFLRKVSFVIVVEPSRLVTTAQIGLNLLIRCCGGDRSITFCSVDRNCDGLVDALSHILMTNITEVSATEYPHGISSYMYWTADDDYLQHRILPGVSRCLGMGTELSMVALRNQVKKTVWYGGETFPVVDARWIAKQYYYDLLGYAQLPPNQETFDKSFHTSFNMCDERVSDLSYITVEDDRNNLFETRRNFATIAEQQGFINVISSEYMLREYMASNTEVFTTDAKAIPYITADYARTKRNAILSLCLLLCIDSVKEDMLQRQMVMLNIDTKDPISEIWKEVCLIFGTENVVDKKRQPVLVVKTRDGKTVHFEKDRTILYKRAYSMESGKFESVYAIEDTNFSRLILDDLQNASYIAEQESKDVYIGTELKGHVYQKYMPGQFFTLNGKYYEMVSTATDNRILVRRASEHIGGRLSYRQIRNYKIHHLEDSSSMGALRSVNSIDIHYQYADLSVETPGYWKLRAHNDFDNGDLVMVNGVPVREYHHKQVLKFDFHKLGDAFTDSVRMTLTNLLNEVFVTLFADNQPFISAVTPGSYDAPLTYSLDIEADCENVEKCIFIIEDSQLDIGLLIAVERNVNRILQIISDYLAWNDEMIEESVRKCTASAETKSPEPFDVYAEKAPSEKKKGLFVRIGAFFRKLLGKKDSSDAVPEEEMTPRQRKRAEKKALRKQKKDLKREEKLRRKQKKQGDTVPEAEKQEEPVSGEVSSESMPPDEGVPVPVEEKSSAQADEDTPEEEVGSTDSDEESSEADEETGKETKSEGEVNEDA